MVRNEPSIPPNEASMPRNEAKSFLTESGTIRVLARCADTNGHPDTLAIDHRNRLPRYFRRDVPRQDPLGDPAADQRAGQDVRGEVDVIVDAGDSDAGCDRVDDRRHDPAVVVSRHGGCEGEGVGGVSGWEALEVAVQRMKGMAPFILDRPRAAEGALEQRRHDARGEQLRFE